jgi:hypothetical protein
MLKATWKKQKDNSDVAEKETLFNKVAVLWCKSLFIIYYGESPLF